MNDAVASGVRKSPTPEILTCYMNNKIRLLAELAKDMRVPGTINNIRAYLHIVRSLEEVYDLGYRPVDVRAEGL